MLSFGSILNGLESIGDWISNTVSSITGIFSDVDFTILYNWLPGDIAAVISSVIAVLLVLALIGLLKKLILFLG